MTVFDVLLVKGAPTCGSRCGYRCGYSLRFLIFECLDKSLRGYFGACKNPCEEGALWKKQPRSSEEKSNIQGVTREPVPWVRLVLRKYLWLHLYSVVSQERDRFQISFFPDDAAVLTLLQLTLID